MGSSIEFEGKFSFYPFATIDMFTSARPEVVFLVPNISGVRKQPTKSVPSLVTGPPKPVVRSSALFPIPLITR